MGLFDSLFGSSSKQSSNSSTSGTTTQNQSNTGENLTTSNQTSANTGSTNTTGTQATQTQQTGTQNQVTSTLDADTINQLKTLLGGAVTNAGGAVNATGNSDALKTIASTAFANGTGGNDSTVDASIAADQAQAKIDFSNGEGTQIAGLEQGIGSKNNTYSQLLEQKGTTDLATSLQKISADAKLQELGLNNNDLQTAIGALTASSGAAATDANTALAPLLAIVSALKGATSTTTGATTVAGSTSETATQQTIQDLINAITGTSDQNISGTATAVGTTNSNTTASGKSSDSPGLLPSLMSLF